MKIIAVILFSILLLTSCDKVPPRQPHHPRQIQFVLYTEKDFRDYNGNINFTLTIRNGASKTLWDSTLSTMKIKDIPSYSNRIVIDKLVPNDDMSTLRAGFVYSIEHVGIAWHMETVDVSQSFKKVEFSFR